MPIQNDFITAFSKGVWYPFLDAQKRARVDEATRQAFAHEQLSLEELRTIQMERFRQILGHALEHSAFYRERYGPVEARNVTRESIGELPTVTKDDVMDHRGAMRCPTHSGRVFSGMTSGSTGKSMVFDYDSTHIAWNSAVLLRGRRWFGLERGDRELCLWARPVDASPRESMAVALKYRLRNVLQFDVFEDFGPERAAEIVARLRGFRPKVIYGYGSMIGMLARHMHREGDSLLREERPVIVEYTADHMLQADQQLAVEVFGAPVLSAYGASETPAIAQMCPRGKLHVSIDHVLVEFLRRDGSRADADEDAEIVVTNLNNYCMPLVRYRVEDLGAWIADPCECGSVLPTMRLNSGKAVDVIETSTHQGITAHLFDYINLHLIKKGIHGIYQFFVTQTAPDRFELDVVRDQPFDPQAIHVFIDQMKEHLGSQIEVQHRYVSKIPTLPSGKRRYFKKAF